MDANCLPLYEGRGERDRRVGGKGISSCGECCCGVYWGGPCWGCFDGDFLGGDSWGDGCHGGDCTWAVVVWLCRGSI